MDDGEISAFVERFDGFLPRMIEGMREGGDTERADKMEKQWGEMKKLLDAGKKPDAQKLYDEVMGGFRRRR